MCDLRIVAYLLLFQCVLPIVPKVRLTCIVRIRSRNRVSLVQCLPSEALFYCWLCVVESLLFERVQMSVYTD